MATAKPKGGLTYADYAATPDDERWELIDGVLYRMAPAPNTKHQQVLFNLVSAFVLHFSRFGQQGQLFFAPTDLILSDGTTVQPDMLFVSEDRRGIIALRGCEGPPDLVVEILSPSNTAHDLDVKRELYARFIIPEYLILDTDTETVWALTEPITDVNGGVYTVETLYHPSDVLTTAAVPGLTIAVADIFASRL
jgi:Uma2 family endonuclease